jgi:signal transduction histidine kinase
MGGFLAAARIACVSLLAAGCAALLPRLSSRAGRLPAAAAIAFSAFFGVHLALPAPLLVSDLLVMGMAWSAGLAALGVSGAGWIRWTGATAALAAVMVLAPVIGYRGTVVLDTFRAFVVGAVAVVPLALLLRASIRRRSAALAAPLACGVAWLAAAAADLACTARGQPAPGLALWGECMMAGACSASLLFGVYPGALTGAGAPGGGDGAAAGLSARILAAESAMELQDGLVASGLLALGAAHDFKNTLGNLKVAAGAGLERARAADKDKSLRLIREISEAGGEQVVRLLERLSRQGREEPAVIRLDELVSALARLARAAYRGEGHALSVEVETGLAAAVRRHEIEQVLFNLIRNAADALARARRQDGLITVRLIRAGDAAAIDVMDNAGGVSPGAVGRLFGINPGGEGGTGVGLYLSRSLAERNGGSLSYEPVEGGSCFRLTLPLADGQEAAGASPRTPGSEQ